MTSQRIIEKVVRLPLLDRIFRGYDVFGVVVTVTQRDFQKRNLNALLCLG
jgi:hypothetical protein